MNRKRPASAPPPVPSEDGAIDRALETIDAQCEAWRAALEPLAAKPERPGDAARVGAVEEAKSELPVARPARRGLVVYEEVQAEAAPTEKLATAVDEEERALLATLDPEIVREVHMLRRLRGSRPSVRDLIEEVRATNPGAGSPGGKKKTWWRIGNT